MAACTDIRFWTRHPPLAQSCRRGYASVVTRILAAGAVVLDTDGRILLVLRGRPPQAGRWSLPGGRVEPGESLAQVVEREVLEETGFVVRALHECGRIEIPGDGADVFDVHDFVVEYLSGTLVAGDDARDARWFTAHEVVDVPVSAGLMDHLRRWGAFPRDSGRG